MTTVRLEYSDYSSVELLRGQLAGLNQFAERLAAGRLLRRSLVETLLESLHAFVALGIKLLGVAREISLLEELAHGLAVVVLHLLVVLAFSILAVANVALHF